MRIAATVLVGAALIAGCSTSDSSAGKSSSADSSASAKAAKKSTPYFEVNGADGNSYVFGSVESMTAYQQTRKLPPMTTHYSKGKAVQIEELTRPP